jgi:hypothetical protein
MKKQRQNKFSSTYLFSVNGVFFSGHEGSAQVARQQITPIKRVDTLVELQGLSRRRSQRQTTLNADSRSRAKTIVKSTLGTL